jgi:hypothetical protein
VDKRASEQQRESELLSRGIDPIAREVLDLDDPWDAYHAAQRVEGALPEDWPELPHGGATCVAWAGLTDLYATGKTPIAEAHGALRQAASNWLERPGPPTQAFIENWLSETSDAVRSLVDRDGDWWSSPS